MFEVRSHIARNRLVLKLSGTLSEDELGKLEAAVQREVERLRPGFDVINDIRELDEVSIAPTDIAAVIGKVVRVKGCHRVVRVVGKKASVALQFERASKTHGFSANLAYSMEEAERLLDGYTG